MTLQLVRICRGILTVVATGDRPTLNRKIKQLRSSTSRGISGSGGKKYPVEYRIRESE